MSEEEESEAGRWLVVGALLEGEGGCLASDGWGVEEMGSDE